MNKVGQALKGTGEFIAENKKPILYVGGAAIVVVISVGVVKSFKKGADSFFNPFSKAKGADEFVSRQIDIESTGITEDLAKTYANQLYNAMRKTGTDEDTIKAILNSINGEDFKMVYNAFGTKSYFVEGEPTLLSWLFGWRDLDLVEWFKKEVSSVTDPITYSLIKKRVTEAEMAF